MDTATYGAGASPTARGSSNWQKFRLLMWKNWLLQWRHRLQMAIEILVPVIFSALLVLIRSMVDPEAITEVTRYQPLRIDTLDSLRNNNDIRLNRLVVDYRLAFAPNTSAPLRQMLDEAASSLRLAPSNGYADSAALEMAMKQHGYLAGVDFLLPAALADSDSELPKRLRYNLRFPSELRTGRANPVLFNWRTNLAFPPFQVPGPRNRYADDGGIPPGYHPEGFLAIQNAIAAAFMHAQNSPTPLPTIELQRYPYPPYIHDILLTGLENLVSLIIMLSFVYPCANTVKFIAAEKEQQLKEAMKIMGLPNWLHWTGWFIRSMLYMTISITLIVVLLKVPWYPGPVSVSVFTHSSATALWFFLFVYSIVTTTFCFMLSVFFARANTAAAVSGLVWFLFYSVFTFTYQSYDRMALAFKLVLSLLSNTGMAFGFQLIVRWEGSGDGLQWWNLFTPVSVDDNLSVGQVIIMLLVAAVLYFLIALYVEKIYPGDYGVPEPWYFPVSRTFWCGRGSDLPISTSATAADEQPDETHTNPQHFEPEPTQRPAGVRIRGLQKQFAGGKTAVHPMHLNMYDDQITVLLGHNGAGKSTTMSMLTGMLRPTAGGALVGGYDVRTELAQVRSSLGLCPQHNILFDELSVEEHIVFYASLKGMRTEEIGAEVDKYLALIGLEAKRKALSKTLSGGMKRKLSVCVAFCGGSRVVLCDEPTSGMDPQARRALWDVLRAEKKGRTVVLTTHFMDEADVLGDRIAIMANGRVKCCGSAYFLKKTFGVGYHLVCVKGAKCRPDMVTELLRGHCADVRVENNVGAELSYQLADSWSAKFPAMFVELEERLDEVGLNGFGVSLTTLEEVFMAVGTDGKELLVVPGVGGEREEEVDMLFNSLETAQLLTGFRLIAAQITTLMHKKILQTYRNLLMLLIQIIIPAIFIIITVLSEQSRARFGDLPRLPIDYHQYRSTVSLLHTDPEAGNIGHTLSNAYRQLFDGGAAEITRSHKLRDIDGGDVEQSVLEAFGRNTPGTNREWLVGASVRNDSSAVAWFSNQPYHSAALSVRMLHEAAVRAALGPDYGIEVANWPIPYTADTRMEMIQLGASMGFQLAVNVSFAMAFVAAFYVLAYIRERTSGSKHLQLVSGSRVISYWMTALAWDYLTYMLTVVVLLVIFAAFQEKGWSSPSDLGRITFVLAVFGWSILPCTYLASRLFTVPASGYTRMAMFYVFTGMACFFIVFVMSLPAYDLKHVADGLTWAFLLFPHFALSHSLNSINLVVQTAELCRLRCEAMPFCTKELMCSLLPTCCNQSYYGWAQPGIGRNLLYLSATGGVALIWLLLLEYRVFAALTYRIRSRLGRRPSASATRDPASLDGDVLAERQLVASMSPDAILAHNLVVRGMTRDYGRFRAVNKMSVAVGAGECFGLLGINGAGKTSTFGMLTGSLRLSAGNAWVRGLSVRTQMTEVHKCIGYCPQFDGLIGEMTGRETLRMFCALRGVRAADRGRLTRVLATELGFERHLDKPVAAYSGGNKRKLSTAVALVGNPRVVYLDEPTTGMDPNAKRCVWNVVSKVRRMGKSVVLTSHSMDECEALCTRLAIMVGGEFRCVGAVQHLKQKYASGYTLVVKLGRRRQAAAVEATAEDAAFGAKLDGSLETDIGTLKAFIRDQMPGAQLQHEFQEQLTYHIGNATGNGALLLVDPAPEKQLRWSQMFAIMEDAKRRFNIEDYALSQTSLEQVFLNFASEQAESNLRT